MLAALALLSVSSPAAALEEQYEMLSASVEVAPIFGLAFDNPSLNFPQVSPGHTEILGEGHYHNQVTCRANSGRAWYLKAELVSLKHLQQAYTLPPSQLKFKVAQSTGSNEPSAGAHEFTPFAEGPMLIYASQGVDNKGKPVTLSFQYSLTCPLDAPAGSYVGQITFTMAENL